ncbi:hypothetical protein L228DRAFT_266077 [Xylona heveae TC161]|uniref:BTB domain-containing protein n=1 Tax=Xylona heveae (strain CBS 132557 / TC161) TaxID=1328760 RepID=A0A161TH99_XYLHT|nr:hypothetical protein L228DRAFT_266077 [Xylona heveae TC161]KZF25617.1 hypothetical protein L228DRAFT_266077 [Xylona heveae TC161]
MDTVKDGEVSNLSTSKRSEERSESTKLSRPMDLFDKIFWIVVGKEGRIFGIHKGLLCDVSSFFKDTFKNRLSASSQMFEPLRLPEISSDTFEIFNTWLYTRSFEWTKVRPEYGKPYHFNHIDLESIANIYLFADSYGILDLKDHCINVFLECYRLGNMDAELFPFEKTLFQKLCGNPSKWSLAKMLLADIFVNDIYDGLWSSRNLKRDSLPECFYFDVLEAQLRRQDLVKNNGDLEWEEIFDPCNYHEHAENSEECRRVSEKFPFAPLSAFTSYSSHVNMDG